MADKCLITHSLLSSWLYSLRENSYEDATSENNSREDFLRVLRREPTATTDAMQKGIDFEDLVTRIAEGCTRDDDRTHNWVQAAHSVALEVHGGVLQHKASREISVQGHPLLLYGRLDALKAGTVYDIKFSGKYERGKFFDSTQHPTYLELVPAATRFSYLVSNGTEVWQETYLREETPDIKPIIADFLDWLDVQGLMSLYREKWATK